MPSHVLGHGRLTHRDRQLQEFSVNPRRTPHRGFAVDSSRIRARTSVGTRGRPVRCRLFQVQNSRKPRRCHVTTVSGVTMCTAVRQPRQACANHAHRRRSTNVRRRRGRRDRLMTASWCRRAMISRCSGEPRLGGQIGASRAAKRRRMTRLQAIGECPQPQSMQHVRSSR